MNSLAAPLEAFRVFGFVDNSLLAKIDSYSGDESGIEVSIGILMEK